MSRAYNVIDADGHILEPLGPWTKKPHSTPSRRSARKPGSIYSDSWSQSVLKAYRQVS